jgi:glycerate dehydrogenase
MGDIGYAVARMAMAMDMNVLAYQRTPKKELECGQLRYCSLEVLLEQSDIISIHCPLTDETRGLVNDEFLSKMKDSAYLINTSRGAVIDQGALYRALKDGVIAGAAIDVLVKEPPERDEPLLTLDNRIITPHAAWVSIEARRRLISILADNMRSFVKSGKGINRVF